MFFCPTSLILITCRYLCKIQRKRGGFLDAFISVCIIGKNEENCIKRCLDAIQKFRLPIVYTDTGSTDGTVDIASCYTDHIYHFDWCNDFSKARNFCAAQAPTDWIWFLDCDEYVTDINLAQLRRFCNPENAAVIGTVNQKDRYSLNGEQTFTLTKLGRIYHRDFCHYDGAVHEQIVSISKEAAIQYHDLLISIDHDGYQDPAVLQKKCERNAALLLQELSQKEDPYLYYQLGKCYQTLQKTDLAAEAFSKGLSFDLDPSLFYVQSMVHSYGYCLLDLKQYEVALSFEGIYDAFSSSADFVFLMGLIYMNNARFPQAIEQFRKATAFSHCTVDGTNSYRAYYNIGVICECLGQTHDAIINYKKCGNFTPAISRLEVLTNA